MVNLESGFGKFESSDDDSATTTKEKSKSKRQIHVPLEAPKQSVAPEAASEAPSAFAALKKPEKDQPIEQAETAPEVLSPEETQHAVQEIAKDHLASLEQADEQVQSDAEHAIEFLREVENGTDPDEALHHQMTELGLAEDEIEEILAETTEPEAAEEYIEPVAAGDPEVTFNPAEDDEGEVILSSQSTMVTPAPAPGASSTSGSGGGGRATPTPMPMPGSGGGAVSNSTLSPNRSFNVMPAAANTYYSQRRNAGELLLVGLVGYLIGRRRGRIKAEKRLLPVQKKLETQVRSLEQDIASKEQKLVVAQALVTERRQPTARTEATPRPAIERTQPGRNETRLGMEKPVRAERLGRMIVTAEAPKSTVRATPEEVKTMNRAELLEVSDKIIIEGASLRQIYESRLIGERQLRHLVSEHLQGKDIRRDLRHEMVEHEIDFERDPILRDRVRSRLSGNETGGGLGDLIANAGVTTGELSAELQQRINREEQRRVEQDKRHYRQRVIADSAMVTAVVVLAVAVVILALNR